MARRFLPVILPGALLLASAPPRSGTRAGPRRCAPRDRGDRPRVPGAARREYVARGASRRGHVEYAGIIPRLEQLAGSIGDDDLLIVESRDAAPTCTSWRCRSPTSTRATCSCSTRRCRTRRRSRRSSSGRARATDACSSSAAAAPTCCRRRWSARAVAERSVPGAGVRSAGRTRIRAASRRRSSTTASTSSRPPAPATPEARFDLDVGMRDDLNVVRFHAKEVTEGRTFRWTQDSRS